jgi:hypothetical protein
MAMLMIKIQDVIQLQLSIIIIMEMQKLKDVMNPEFLFISNAF